MDKFTLLYTAIGLALVFLLLVVFARINRHWNYAINPEAIQKLAAIVLLAWLGNCVVTLCMFLIS